MISKLLVAATMLAGLAVFLVALAWMFQERIAFQPPGGPWPDPVGVSRIDYSATDGQRLFAYVAGDPAASGKVLIAFHGNADLAVWQTDWANEVVRNTGVPVILAEYRGYMGLAGRPTYDGSKLDASAAYLFARDSLRIPARRIALFGHSLGSAIATELALSHRPAALLLQAPFTSARDMAARMTGYLPANTLWRFISRLHFDTGAGVALVEAPVSVSHGRRDKLIPPQMGEVVFAAAKQKGAWLLVPDAAHNDVDLRGGDAYWAWMMKALEPLK